MNLHSGIISIILILFASVFQSCNNDKEFTSKNLLFGKLSQPLIDSLKPIGQEIQKKQIDPTKDTVVIGKNGTRFFITANSIVNNEGVPVKDKVILELKENYSLADMITTNLQTISGDSILQTQGMLYFNASGIDGKPLKIDRSKPVRIEFPVKENIKGVKIFNGQRVGDGNIDWQVVSEPATSLIPFPIRTLAPVYRGECPKDLGITNDREYYNKWKGEIYLTFDTISKYENTLIATREFADRFYSYCMPELTKIYINNLNKNMWEIDEMMVQYFIKDSADRVNIQIRYKPQPYGNNKNVTKEQEDAYQWLIDHEKEWGHRMIEIFKEFASQRLTKIDTSKKVDTTLIKEANTAFIAYDALEFGWVNVDYFYNDPNAIKLKLITKVIGEASIINLILPGRSIILSGILKGNNTYWFTKQEDGYNKLPKGEKAIIICIGISNNKLTFADKEIIIGQNEMETLTMMEMPSGMIKSRLKNLSIQ